MLYDDQVLEEIALLGELMAVAAAAAGVVSPSDVDRALTLGREELLSA